MAAYAIPLLVASVATQAIGQIQQAQVAKKAADYNAALAEQNAAVQRQQAGAREEAQRREAGQVLGAQRAAFAQSGGGMGGSAADVMQQSATNAELDALTLRYEGELRARGLEAEAAGERFAGKAALSQGYFNAAPTILSGASQYGEMKAGQKYRAERMRRGY
jgi:hypothetical protein